MTASEQAIRDERRQAGRAMSVTPERPTFARLWQLSAPVVEKTGLRRLRARVDFVLKAMKLRDSLQAFIAPTPGSSLQRALAQRPEMIGAAVWPYICVNWGAKQRLQHIEEHFKVIDAMGGPLDFPIDRSLEVLDLSDIQASLRVVLDHPRWFMREGQFVLNLFVGDVRIYSIAFSFGSESDRTVAHIGAIQGGNSDGVMADYKDLTKTLHGMRPRDFLVELLRSLCRAVGVTKIYAVADASRQHRSSYFGTAKAETLSLDYDDIWTERGGMKDSDDFFVLALDAPLKPLEEVASKKRAMYRRRYDLLESLDARIAAVCAGVPYVKPAGAAIFAAPDASAEPALDAPGTAA